MVTATIGFISMPHMECSEKREEMVMWLFSGATQAPEPEPSAEAVETLIEEKPNPVKVLEAVISSGIVVTGRIQGEDLVQVEGTVDGEICMNGAVVVCPSGSVKGTIQAKVVRVGGGVTGNITALEHVKLEGSGIVDGDIKTTSIVIDDGAWFNGQVTMKRPENQQT